MAQVLNQEVTSPTGAKVYVSGASPTDVNTEITRINPNAAPVVNPTMLGTQPLQISAPTYVPPPNISNLPGSTAAAPTATTPTAPPAGQTNTFTDKLSGLVAKFTGKATDKQMAETAATSPLESQKAQLAADLQRVQADTLAQEEAATNRVGGTTGTNSIATQQVQRTGAIQGLLLQSRLNALDGNIASAKATADQAIESKYAQIQQDIQTERNNIYNNWDSFTAAEKKRASATLLQIDANDQYAKQNIEDEKAIQAMAAVALANNPNNPAVQLAIDSATESGDLMTATKMLAQYQKDAQAVLLQAGQLQAQRDAHAKAMQEISASGLQGITNPAAAPYATVLSTILGSGKFTKDQSAAVTRAINSGEDPFTVVKNQAKNIMGQTEATKLSSYEAADSAMQDLANKIQAYYDGKGDTGLLSGTFEQVINKLGSVNDPKKVELATQVAISLQAYRNAISGTAYSNQEGQQINAVFPGINKSQGLNKAIITGRLAADASIIDGIYATALGQKTYQALKSAQTGSASPFDKYANDITPAPNGTDAYIPRSVWTTIEDKDGLLAYVKSLGKNLLVQ